MIVSSQHHDEVDRVSFDIYCYRPTSNSPSIEEARAIVETEEEVPLSSDNKLFATKSKIVDALLANNPRLKRFQSDYRKIAEQMKITEDQARARFSHIELSPPAGDNPIIQITVRSDHVFLSIPYWYSGPNADQAFEQLNGYLHVIRDAAGFFAYDPQEDRAFDPAAESLWDHSNYDRIVQNMPAIAGRAALQQQKPWWKFW